MGSPPGVGNPGYGLTDEVVREFVSIAAGDQYSGERFCLGKIHLDTGGPDAVGDAL